jgi:hypothetical protein
MTFRAQFGRRSGVSGAWISKPGIDVRTALPGDMLLDTSAQVFQCIAKGDTLILNEGKASIPAGTYGTAVALPASLAPFSNVAMMASYYEVSNAGVVFDAQTISQTYLTFRVSAGVLFLNVTFRSAGGTGTTSVSFQHRAAWSVYRGQF